MGTGTDNNGIILQTFGDGAWGLHRPNVAITADTTPVLVGQTQHVAAVLNGGAWQLWVDGTLRASFNNAAQDPGAGIRIGAGNAGTGDNRGFDGVIETVRVFEYSGTFDIRDTLYNGPARPITDFIEVLPNADFSIAWDGNEGNFSTPDSPAPVLENDASTSRGAVAFGSSELDFGVHYIPNVNDGFYGNAHSWMPDWSAVPDPMPFIGINFGRRIALRSIAWGRDNGDTVETGCAGGTCTDRTLGVYVLQITTVPDPGLSTPEVCGINPEAGWVTIGMVNYKDEDPNYFTAYLRHRFDVTQGGNPIAATGLRILVPNNEIDIDEIEVNANQAIEQEAIQIASAPGLSITWDGNDGQFNDLAAGAASPPNRALASEGTTAFGSSQLDLGVHFITNVNNGLYGNSQSWIPDFTVPDPDPFIGLSFGGEVGITNIAWSRDNGDTTETGCAGGTCVDRALDSYRLQYTLVGTPDATTPDTGDAFTGWADLGTVTYVGDEPPFFTSYLRHRFEVSEAGGPVNATGIRIKISNPGTALDEIEVNTSIDAPPPLGPVGLNPAFGFEIAWDGNEGHFFDPAAGAAAPSNRALASEGTTAFGSSELDLGVHFSANVNDGLYGNNHSWISANGVGGTTDPDPFVGLSFGETVAITNIAWSRDNGDTTEPPCGGTCTDRSLGVYTLQITSVPMPDAATIDTGEASTGWATLGTIDYRRNEPPEFSSYLRHRFEVSTGGFPVEATGLRIKVPDGLVSIDEIEVNTAATRPLPQVRTVLVEGSLVISWTGGGGLLTAISLEGPWECVGDVVSPYTVSMDAGSSARFYRVVR